MHPLVSADARGRTRALRLLLLGAATAGLSACENVPPFLERSSIRASGLGIVENLKIDDERKDGPFAGVALGIETLCYIERTSSFGLEAEVQALKLESDWEFDDYGFRFFAGPRWHWNLDDRYQPHAGVGAFWTDFHFDNHDRSFDPNGPGGYADVGIDWMVTPRHAIGTRLRGTLRYERADHNNGMVPGLELAMTTSWRF